MNEKKLRKYSVKSCASMAKMCEKKGSYGRVFDTRNERTFFWTKITIKNGSFASVFYHPNQRRRQTQSSMIFHV